jgi:hypothetical protein
MLTTAALLTCLLQAGSAIHSQTDAPAAQCLSCIEENVEAVESPPRPELLEEQEFVGRFNKLITALREFSRNYNSRGTIDVKQVRRIQKAVRDLEKSPWFRQSDDRRGAR